MENISRIALIAGNGSFPLFVANAATSAGTEVIAIAIKSEADKKIEKIAKKVYWLNLGEAGKLVDILKKEGIRHAVMAGKITKLTLFKESMRLDKEAKRLLSKAGDRKDDTLLLAVAGWLKEFGVELMDSTAFIKGSMVSKGLLTKKGPSQNEKEDIGFGYRIAKEMGALDIGQSVAVKDKAIIAVEAIEGTDAMIKRAGALVRSGTVIVKVSKPNQDMRFDVPVIGPNTIESLKEAGSSVLALEADKVLVLDKKKVIEEADKHSIAIVAI